MWIVDQAAEDRERHEYQVAALRPTQPLAVWHLRVKAVYENDPALGVIPVHPVRERPFADEAAPRLRQLVATTRLIHGSPAAVSGCDMHV